MEPPCGFLPAKASAAQQPLRLLGPEPLRVDRELGHVLLVGTLCIDVCAGLCIGEVKDRGPTNAYPLGASTPVGRLLRSVKTTKGARSCDPPRAPRARRCDIRPARRHRGQRRAQDVDRLPRRSELPLAHRSRRQSRRRHPGRLDRDPRLGVLAADRADEAGEPVRPVRPGLPDGRSRRARAQRPGQRRRDPVHDLGRAEVGERRQGRQLRAEELQRLADVLQGRRRRATAAGMPATRSCASTRSGTSRT